MAVLARRAQRSTNIWPGFVDALATLLMVTMFLLMVFVLAQFFLSEALSGRDEALNKLQNQVGELADLLALERRDNTEIRANLAQLSEELQVSVALRDDLKSSLAQLRLRADTLETDLAEAGQTIAGQKETIAGQKETIAGQKQTIAGQMETIAGQKETIAGHEKSIAAHVETIAVDKETIALQIKELAALNHDIAALRALRAELEAKIAELATKVETSDKALLEERELSDSARAQVALLNQQMAALREQLGKISEALEASELLTKEQKVQIASLGKRLNAALASKVQELSRYRSEFFGRLREVLGARPGIRVVGDRFVFQSEVLFAKGSADIGDNGVVQLDQLATTLLDIAGEIPGEIDWVLRIDGHTDSDPIKTPRFPSNWELSSARAISVVQHLVTRGLPPNRLVAAGFGEFQPIDTRPDEIAKRRNRRIELKLTQR